jgi:hypothetical protein
MKREKYHYEAEIKISKAKKKYWTNSNCLANLVYLSCISHRGKIERTNTNRSLPNLFQIDDPLVVVRE